MRHIILATLVLATLSGCGGDDEANSAGTTTTVEDATTTAPAGSDLPTEQCDQAFADAASQDDMSDTVEDLYPAARACESIADWVAASENHPSALDGADPEAFAINVCAFGEDAVAGSALCEELGSA
jgi:hypothetical protein